MKTEFRESNFEEDIDLKNQFRNNILPDPINIREAASKIYVDINFNAASLRKTLHHFTSIVKISIKFDLSK